MERVALSTDVELASQRLRAGGLVAIPTETVYGLGALASSPQAVGRVFAAKGRPADHPLIVHIADAGEVDRWADPVPSGARALADAFWPGPLTLLLRRRSGVHDVVTGGLPTVGLRVPDHPLTLELLRLVRDGVAAPSANRFGKVSPTTAQHVLADLGDVLDPTRDLILDGGPCVVGLESTIVDLSGPAPLLLRHGGIPGEAVSAVLGIPVAVDVGPARAPGMLVSHYAPSARVVGVTAVDLTEHCATLAVRGATIAVLADHRVAVGRHVIRLPSPDPYDAAGLAGVLYARFRDADAAGATHLVVQLPAGAGIGAAVIDRVIRAAASTVRVGSAFDSDRH